MRIWARHRRWSSNDFKCSDLSQAVNESSRSLADQLTEPFPHLDVLMVGGIRIQQIDEIIRLGQLFTAAIRQIAVQSKDRNTCRRRFQWCAKRFGAIG